jgi:hypothetical protein
VEVVDEEVVDEAVDGEVVDEEFGGLVVGEVVDEVAVDGECLHEARKVSWHVVTEEYDVLALREVLSMLVLRPDWFQLLVRDPLFS